MMGAGLFLAGLPPVVRAENQQFQVVPPPLPMMRLLTDWAELSNDLIYLKAKAGGITLKGGGYTGVFNAITSTHTGVAVNFAFIGMGGDLPSNYSSMAGFQGDMGFSVLSEGVNFVVDPLSTPARNQKGWALPISVGPTLTMMNSSIVTSYLRTNTSGTIVSEDDTVDIFGVLYGWQAGIGVGIPLDRNNYLRLFPFATLNQNLGGSFTVTTDLTSTSADAEKSPPSTSYGMDIQIPRWNLSVGSIIQQMKKQKEGDDDVKTTMYRLSWTLRFSAANRQARLEKIKAGRSQSK
ncbi:MAG TPA: hypothetical protein P5079_05055 [Elusimicrobiota bacterium]|nr:hypothetical protein [Elusimicrobiota bacterium]